MLKEASELLLLQFWKIWSGSWVPFVATTALLYWQYSDREVERYVHLFSATRDRDGARVVVANFRGDVGRSSMFYITAPHSLGTWEYSVVLWRTILFRWAHIGRRNWLRTLRPRSGKAQMLLWRYDIASTSSQVAIECERVQISGSSQ